MKCVPKLFILAETDDTNSACGDEAAAVAPAVAVRDAAARHNLYKVLSGLDPRATTYHAPYIPH
ncbi:MAG TPA: hypothetical protein VIH72_11810 [Candidatus Acidoferrales bacterium]